MVVKRGTNITTKILIKYNFIKHFSIKLTLIPGKVQNCKKINTQEVELVNAVVQDTRYICAR